jgi:hypothetical protein
MDFTIAYLCGLTGGQLNNYRRRKAAFDRYQPSAGGVARLSYHKRKKAM